MAEVADFLNALDDRDKLRRVEDVLVMCLLPYARQHQGTCDDNELRRTCLEACDTIDKHASTLRQTLRVEARPANAVTVLPVGASHPTTTPSEAIAAEEVSEKTTPSQPQPQIESSVTADQISDLFGG